MDGWRYAVSDGIDRTHRVFVSYIDKSREYYLAQDYGNPYRWAYHDDAPFTPLAKPLASCRVGLVTTASLMDGHDSSDQDEPPPSVVFASPTEPVPRRLNTTHRFWDKEATHTEDLDSYLPLRRLAEYAREGRIGSVSPRFYGIPTEYSQRKTVENDAPELLRLCRDDGVDAALLVPL